MTIMESLKALHKEWSMFKYGIPVDGKIQNGDAEWWNKHYRFLSPEELVKYKGGVCWDFVEFGRDFLIKLGVDPNIIHQIYIITDTPPNYDTHTFLVCEYDDGYLYVESSFKKVDEMIGGVKRFNTIEDICKLITETMFQFNGNDRFKSFKYDVIEFKNHPPYGSTCSEYMDWMNDNGEMIHQGVAMNPNKHLMDEEIVEVFKEYVEDIPPKKISLTYDTLYFGSKNKIKGNIKLRNDQLFVTPFITLASIFAVEPRGDFKCPVGSYNLQYDEWKKPCEVLIKETKPLKNVNISIEGCPDLIPYSMESSGYIYAIDASKVKDNIYQLDWMDRDREFIIKGLESIKVKEVIEVTATCNIRGEKSDSPKHHVSKFVPSDFTTENTFMRNKSVYLTSENLEAYKDKCKDFKIGLKHLRINENVRGQIWPDSKNNVSAYIACEKQDDKVFIIGLEIAPNQQHKGLGKELLDFAVYVYGASHLSVNKKDTHAFDLFQRCGWKVYDETDKMYYMRRRDVNKPIQEAVLSTKERDELKDSEFGIPELRQYPLNDEVHVKQAVKMFSHAPKKYRKELAKRIIAKANKFGIDNTGWDEIHKYNVLNYIRESYEFMSNGDIMKITGKEDTIMEHSVLMSNEEFFAEYHDDKKKVLKDLKEREENVEIKKQRDIVKKIIQKGPYGEYDNAKKKFVLNTNKILKGMSAKGYTDDDKRVVYKYLMKIVSDLEKLRDTNQFGKFNKAKHDILRMVGKETDEERVVCDIKFIDPYNSKINRYALPRKIYGINKCAIIGFSSVENQVFKPFSKTRYFHSMDKPMTGTSLNPSHKAKDGPVYPSDRVYFIAYNCTNSEPTELDLDPGFRVSRYYEYIPKKGDVFYIDKEYHNYDSTRKMVFINTKKSLPVKDVTNEILENSSKRRVSESYTYDPEDYEDSEINENNKDEIFNEESYTERNLSIGDESFIMEMNKTMEKTLNRLDYNPKDGTIKVGLKLKNGKMLDRCRLIIGGELYERHGACFYCDNEDLDTVTPENVYVVIGRKELKQRNNTGMAIIQHELGHLKIRMVKSDAESKKLKRAAAKFLQSKPQTKDLLQYTTGEDDYDLSDDDTIDDLYEDAHDMSPEEYAADIESVKATSKHSAIKMLESFMPKIKKQIDNIKTSTDGLTRLIKSAKLNIPVKLSDFINKIEKIEESREGIGKDIIRVYGWMKDADKDIKDLKEKQKNTTNAEELERIVEDIRYKENRKSSFREELKKYKSQYKAADKPDKNDKEIIEKVRKQDNGRDIFDDYLDDCAGYFKFIKYAKMGIDLRIEYVRRYVGESYTERNGVVMNTLMKKQAHIMESYKMGIIHEKEALQLIERVMIENGDDVETSSSSGDTSALASYINSLDEASKQELLDNIESGEDYEDRETSENDEDDEGSADDESTETDESSEEEEKREEDDEDDKVEDDDSDYSDTNLEDIDI